nr:DEAD/DEAH box helicase family protein [Acholeplasmatales bacterium]
AESILKLPYGGLLADQVGMGKTIEAGMIISELAYRDEWRTLIITLSNDELMNNWHDEMYNKFGLTLSLINPSDKDVEKVFNILKDYQETGVARDINGNKYEELYGSRRKFQGVIVPFEYLVSDKFIMLVDNYNKTHKRHFHIDLIVVDESHRYTSSDSASSDNKIKALHKLQIFSKDDNGVEKKLGKILLLTATPIKNDLNELLELMQIINPNYTKDQFRHDLGLSESDSFDLSRVLNNEQGVNKWWGWFSTFGKRHTRIDTNYDPEKRRFGVKWKKKNSYSFYFNDNDLYNTRNYFIDGADSTKIKLVSDKNGVDEISRSELQYAPLKGIRKSDVVEYDIKEVIDDKHARMPYDLFKKKLNNLLQIVKYLKKEISLSELKQMFDSGLINKENDNFSYDDFLKEIQNEEYKKCEGIKVPYGKMGNSLNEIEAKKLIEASIERFIYSYNIKDNRSLLMDSFLDIIKSIVPEQQKNKLGNSLICTEANLAALLCTDNIFLSLYKMKKLGDIINLGSSRELVFTLKDEKNLPVDITLYGGKSSVSIEDVEEKRQITKIENGEIVEDTIYDTKKAYRTTSKLKDKESCVEFVAKGNSSIEIFAKSRREMDRLVAIDEKGMTLSSTIVTNKNNSYILNFNYTGKVQIGFEKDYGYIYSILFKTGKSRFNIDFDNIDYKQHNKEKIIIFCKDDAERRLLVNNSHIWDYEGRYRPNDKSVVESAKQSELSFDRDSANTVSIAYTTDAEGLNLQSYHTMINYSIVLSPLHMEQRVGRIDRIGQRNEMNIYFLANAQDIEGYILRFFEYELELFSNWSGDTTASTYVDSNVGGKSVKKEFDVFCNEVWKNIVINGNQNESKEERVATFERTIVDAFNNVRERVKTIAGYSGQIDEMTQRHEILDEEGFELYYN